MIMTSSGASRVSVYPRPDAPAETPARFRIVDATDEDQPFHNTGVDDRRESRQPPHGCGAGEAAQTKARAR